MCPFVLTHQIRDKPRAVCIFIPWTISVHWYPISRDRGVFLCRCNTAIAFKKMNACTQMQTLWNQPTMMKDVYYCCRLCSVRDLGKKHDLEHGIIFQSHFRSDITLPRSKICLLMSLIYLYYSVSRPCLWFLMQNSTLLLNLWPLCLHFIFSSNTFFASVL